MKNLKGVLGLAVSLAVLGATVWLLQRLGKLDKTKKPHNILWT